MTVCGGCGDGDDGDDEGGDDGALAGGVEEQRDEGVVMRGHTKFQKTKTFTQSTPYQTYTPSTQSTHQMYHHRLLILKGPTYILPMLWKLQGMSETLDIEPKSL